MITYVVMLATVFPKRHIRTGEPTYFPGLIKHYDKIHTIRNNYYLWQKRFEKIDQGKAMISVRIWDAKPYRSKQLEIFKCDKTHGIGLQRLECNPLGWVVDDNLMEETLPTSLLAKNDGLTEADFKDWFKGSFTVGEPKAIIHFTDFRY